MNYAELYHNSNSKPKRDTLKCLEENAKKIQWKNEGDTVIDIGSGDGSVTVSILQQFLPASCKRVLGCDISENMVQFANKHYATATTSFALLDIEADLPDNLKESFDHAFSFFALHWIEQNEKAFENIYNLLAKNGDCLLLFIGHLPYFDVYRILARKPKWRNCMKNINGVVSIYHDCQDSEKEITRMMNSIGFTNVDVQCRDMSYTYTSLQSFKNLIKAVNPFKLPEELLEDYAEDFLDIVNFTRQLDSGYEVVCGEDDVTVTYELITVYAKKPEIQSCH